jgi:hypothetical protein
MDFILMYLIEGFEKINVKERRVIILDILMKTKYIRPISADRGSISGSAEQEIRSREREAIRPSRQRSVSANH